MKLDKEFGSFVTGPPSDELGFQRLSSEILFKLRETLYVFKVVLDRVRRKDRNRGWIYTRYLRSVQLDEGTFPVRQSGSHTNEYHKRSKS